MHSYYVLCHHDRVRQAVAENRTQADTRRNSTNLLTTVSVAVAPGRAAMAALKRTTMEDSFMMIVGGDVGNVDGVVFL